MQKTISLALAGVMLLGAALFSFGSFGGESFADSSSVPEGEAAAVPSGDEEGGEARTEAFAEALMEYQKLQQEIQAVQQQAMEQEEVQVAMQAFEDTLMDHMKAIDDGIEGKLDELQEVAGRIQAIQMDDIDG